MKSVRLDDGLEARLREAAKVVGETESSLIRRAVAEECDRILKNRLDHDLADVIGIVHSGGGRARRTHEAFTDILIEDKHRRNKLQ